MFCSVVVAVVAAVVVLRRDSEVSFDYDYHDVLLVNVVAVAVAVFVAAVSVVAALVSVAAAVGSADLAVPNIAEPTPKCGWTNSLLPFQQRSKVP